jgi:hypothetical protein
MTLCQSTQFDSSEFSATARRTPCSSWAVGLTVVVMLVVLVVVLAV